MSHEEGSDPAAVAYDTVNAAISRKLDIGILILQGDYIPKRILWKS